MEGERTKERDIILNKKTVTHGEKAEENRIKSCDWQYAEKKKVKPSE